jgi:AbrB family looped-hinge helix DNA binding protein
LLGSEAEKEIRVPVVKVKTKYQVTLPTGVRQRVGLKVGDLLEAKVERGKITLTPQAPIAPGIAEGLDDIKKGRVHGPFHSADDLLRSLHREAAKLAKKSRVPA